jgi:hypothetical protein
LRFGLKSLPVRAIASERERKVRFLDVLTDRVGVAVLVVVVMEGMIYAEWEGYIGNDVVSEMWWVGLSISCDRSG